tara:strand:- start:20 stop:1309 length:1290 start_codon:yes stop_codon:yes gene_type:complete
MAVKFSEFSQKPNITEVTEIVGYYASSDLNVRIAPSALDTNYAYSTTDGASPALTLVGTKAGVSDVTTQVTLSGLGGTILAGTGTNAITFRSTTYILAAGANADPTVNTPITLTGDLGGDPHTDTVNLIGTGTVQITSAGGVITIDGGSAGDVTSLDQVAGATSSGQALTVAGTGTGPFTGAVTVASNIYGGTTNVGIVPSGGSATTFLQGDGNWATPTDTDTTYTLPITGSSAAVTATLTGTTGTPDPVLITGGTNVTFSSITSAGFTIDAAGGGGGAVDDVTDGSAGTSTGTPLTITPTTGNVVVASNAYAGQGNVGHVPAGGTAGKYLDGDTGAWITLPSTLSIDKQTFTGNGTLTDFTLTTAAGCTADNLNIYISGVYQNSVDASNAVNYTVGSGLNPTLQFVSAGTPTAPPVTSTRGIEVVITR